MKNTPNKFNIVIPKNGDTSLVTSKTKEEILKDLNGITNEEINEIGEEINSGLESRINKSEEVEEKTEETEYSEERVLMVREFLLRLGYQIINWDPVFLKGKPVFYCKRGEKYAVYHEFDNIGNNIDIIYTMKDEDSGERVGIIEVKGRPTLLVKIGHETIIIRGKDEIDAEIFFRNHGEDYTVQEIKKFLESLGNH